MRIYECTWMYICTIYIYIYIYIHVRKTRTRSVNSVHLSIGGVSFTTGTFLLVGFSLRSSKIVEMANRVLLYLLPLCHLLQRSLAFPQTDATSANRQCLCVPGTTCPSSPGDIDIRIVNTGNTCSPGYVFCCAPDDNSSCGTRKIPPSAHPVGQAAYGAYPWQVAILANDNTYIGGGVLISPTHVLTVAHKVANYVNGGIKARLGEWDAQSTSEPDPYVDISVSRVVLHPEYNSQNLQNDIAVLTLSSAAPIATSPNINTACLPSAAPAAGTRCWVSGWGKDAFGPNGRYQSILKEVDVPVRSQADCQTALRSTRLGQFFILDNSFICAGGESGKDACTGDGGSPLVCSTNNGPFQIVGLVTWGIGCAGAGVPGVYTNVFNFLSWVMQQMT
ncbi:PREDICTED: trypsin-3-like isoform X2 [Dinoponera quadriceps]|uniref:Phenoloxidase-activating factor 2 n=1 Tax=Dinoponera quadriceps TaxID=609295 RepID=A0A6P3XIU5_DINQU|nr:PREDICTED: trypsin-3-like isoform X2 [Dinoponera quadriceps]